MKGRTNNPNGRPKGSKNKGTAEIRKALTSLIERKLPTLESDLDSLDPKDRLQVYEKLLKFVLPTLNRTAIEEDEPEHNRTIIIQLDERFLEDEDDPQERLKSQENVSKG